MAWRTLLVTHDHFLESAFERAVNCQNSNLEVVPDSNSAQKLISKIRFDVVVIDCDDVYGGVLSCVLLARLYPIVARWCWQSQTVRRTRPTLWISVPTACFPSQSTLAKPNRRSKDYGRSFEPGQRGDYRFNLNIPVFVSFGQVAERRAETFNVSRGGLGMRISEPIAQDDLLHLRCCLPGTLVPIQAYGEIAWADQEGNCGIRFIGMSDSSRHVLSDWLDCAQRAPLSAAWRE